MNKERKNHDPYAGLYGQDLGEAVLRDIQTEQEILDYEMGYTYDEELPVNESDSVPMRSVRRHHRERLLAKRVKYHTLNWGNYVPDDKRRKMYIDTPTVCSCDMCGNPRRRHKELTKQELCFLQEQIDY